MRAVSNGSLGYMMTSFPHAGARFPRRFKAALVASQLSTEVVAEAVCWSLALHSVIVSHVDDVFVAVVTVVTWLFGKVDIVAPYEKSVEQIFPVTSSHSSLP